MEEEIFESLRQISINRLKSYSAQSEYEIEEVATAAQPFDRFSMILLWGDFGKLTLKTHYQMSTARSWASELLNTDQESLSAEQCSDFFNEYCNMFGGQVRGELEKSSLLLGMSLPFFLPATDESVFSKIHENQKNFFSNNWIIQREDLSVKITAELTVQQPDRIGTFCQAIKGVQQDDTDGEVEFI